ncbi:MAG: glycosyltransferase [Myxococcota bacterium]|nr:glycosyltransferase [Myxococcota bacterium]
MRVLIYAINGLGMGHLNRTLVLARAMQAAEPETAIHFVVDSPHFQRVSRSGFQVTKFPDRRHPLGFHKGRARRYEDLPELFDVLFQSFEPDALLVDFLCKRALFARAAARGIHLAAVLRKLRPAAARNLALNRGASFVDSWLLPHSAEELPLSELPRSLRARAQHLGPVVRGIDSERVAAQRERFTTAEGVPLVLATIGGGGAGESQQLFDGLEAALSESGRPVRLVMVYGPNYPGPLPTSGSSSGLEVERLRSEPDLPELMAAADLVVCNAGYNTIREVRASGTPALVVPLRTTGRDDQEERARSLADAGRALSSSSDVTEMSRNIAAILDQAVVEKLVPTAAADPAALGRRVLSALEG